MFTNQEYIIKMKKLFGSYALFTAESGVDLDRFFNKCVFELCFKNPAFKKISTFFVPKTKEKHFWVWFVDIYHRWHTKSCNSKDF